MILVIMVTLLIKGVCAKLKYLQASGMNIIDNISEFERLYNPMKCYDMDLSTGVLAYWVLKNNLITMGEYIY